MEKGIDLSCDKWIGALCLKIPAACAAERIFYHTGIEGNAGVDVLDVQILDWEPVQLSHQRSFECLKACYLWI